MGYVYYVHMKCGIGQHMVKVWKGQWLVMLHIFYVIKWNVVDGKHYVVTIPQVRKKRMKFVITWLQKI